MCRYLEEILLVCPSSQAEKARARASFDSHLSLYSFVHVNVLQEMLRHDEISIGHARALIGNDNAEELAQQIKNQDMSVRDIEALTSSKDNKSKSSSSKKPKDPDTRALEKEMSDNLGMDVNINVKKDGHKGDVKITFKSLDQLDYLLHKLSKH